MTASFFLLFAWVGLMKRNKKSCDTLPLSFLQVIPRCFFLSDLFAGKKKKKPMFPPKREQEKKIVCKES